MERSKVEDRILAWCRKADAKRVIGMRETTHPTEPCAVMYLDTMRSCYVGRYGTPDQPLRYDSTQVIASGETWEAVAAKLGLE